MVCCVSGLIMAHTLYVDESTSHNLSFSHLHIVWYQHRTATSISVLHQRGTFVQLSVKTSAFTHYRLTMKINYTAPNAALFPSLSGLIQVYYRDGVFLSYGRKWTKMLFLMHRRSCLFWDCLYIKPSSSFHFHPPTEHVQRRHNVTATE